VAGAAASAVTTYTVALGDTDNTDNKVVVNSSSSSTTGVGDAVVSAVSGKDATTEGECIFAFKQRIVTVC
jgi:hypothetical protein